MKYYGQKPDMKFHKTCAGKEDPYFESFQKFWIYHALQPEQS